MPIIIIAMCRHFTHLSPEAGGHPRDRLRLDERLEEHRGHLRRTRRRALQRVPVVMVTMVVVVVLRPARVEVERPLGLGVEGGVGGAGVVGVIAAVVVRLDGVDGELGRVGGGAWVGRRGEADTQGLWKKGRKLTLHSSIR